MRARPAIATEAALSASTLQSALESMAGVVANPAMDSSAGGSVDGFKAISIAMAGRARKHGRRGETVDTMMP